MAPSTTLPDTLFLPLSKPFTLDYNCSFTCLQLFLSSLLHEGRVTSLPVQALCSCTADVEGNMSQPLSLHCFMRETVAMRLPQGPPRLETMYRMGGICHHSWHRVASSHLAAQHRHSGAMEGSQALVLDMLFPLF